MARKKAQEAAAPAQTKQDGKQKQKQKQPQQRQPQQRLERPAGGMQHYSSFLQVLAVDIDHTSPSVLLFFNKERYLFNAGEGIQRLFREHRIKIKQVTSYFITRISTETLGGLPGMALSVVPEGAGGLLGKQAACTVKGPRGLADYVAAFRGYINAENTVDVEEIDPASTEPLVKTDVVSITPIVVRLPTPQPQPGPAAEADAAEDGVGGGGGDGPAPKRRRTDVGSAAAAAAADAGVAAGASSAEEAADGEAEVVADPLGRQRPAGQHPHPHQEQQGQQQQQVVVAYAVQLAGRPGKFQPDKARELGVTPGPLFGELQRGLSVTTEDGRVVAPQEVMEAAVPGPSVLLVDTPSVGALRAVADNEAVRRFVTESAASASDADGDGGGGGRTCIAVHLAPAAVASDAAALESFRALLGPSWRHLVVTSGPHQPSTLPRASVFQAKLHAISPTAFPLFALGNSHAPPELPEGARPPQQAAATAAAATATGAAKAGPAANGKAESPAVAAASASPGEAAAAGGGGKRKGGKGGGGGAAAAAGAAAAPGVPLLTQQQWPSLPLPPPGGGGVAAMSAVRLNLMPPARQGFEYVDVFQYDSSSKVLEDLRSNPEYGEVLAAAAAARDDGAAAAGPADGARAGEREGGAGGGAAAKVEAEAEEARTETTAMEAETEVAAAEGTGREADGAAPSQAGAEVPDRGGEGAASAAPAADAAAAAAPPAGTGEVAAAARELPVPECVASGDRRQVELTFLGTASSQPSKYRNVSGCYVDLFGRGGLLVDCGEDAMGQMKRRFGNEDAERRLLELRLVWVSHMHADHHGGLYRLLEWRAARGAPPLLVIGPRQLFNSLVRYSAAVPLRGFLFLPNYALSSPGSGGEARPPPAACVEAYEAAVRELGLASLRPFPVEHIADSHGLRLEGRAGWCVVFSGDTRPCAQTVAAARGATLLVHEATFEESMVAEARAKRHSTTAEAVSVGERAGAYRTLLTHFSTRYPTLPELDLGPHPRVAVAMDLMSLNLADLPGLPRLVRPLGLLFRRLEEDKLAEPDDDD